MLDVIFKKQTKNIFLGALSALYTLGQKNIREIGSCTIFLLKEVDIEWSPPSHLSSGLSPPEAFSPHATYISYLSL